MVNPEHNELIGLGVYTLQEAALYGRLSPNKLSRWVFGSRKYEPVIESKLCNHGLVSFYDLVQAMAINSARDEGIPLPKIRQAISTAKDRYGVEFPLAYNHKLVWYDRDLHIQFPDESIIQVSGRLRGQRAIKEIVESFMKDLHFNAEGLVERFTPFELYGRQIVLDPERQFGQPLVGDTGYRADVLANAYCVEQSAELVATAYNIGVKDVQTAVAYIEDIRKAA